MISIHAPSRERRRIKANRNISITYFNPRSLAGVTLLLKTKTSLYRDFNPRSLAGATSRYTQFLYFHLYFNPRSLAGATNVALTALVDSAISIHAPSRERPESLPPTEYEEKNFNPRSLAGATVILCACQRIDKISIHAPSRERLGPFKAASCAAVFQSTLPRGSDNSQSGRAIELKQFQSTLPRGSDRNLKALTCCASISIHAPSRERL